MTKWIPSTGEWVRFNPSISEILLLSSLMCSSDVVAAVSIIDFKKQPKLFSMIFGEGITNDAVSIILFNSVFSHTQSGEEISWTSPLHIGWNFTILAMQSMAVGVGGALAASLLFKHCRFVTHSPIHETLLVFAAGYCSYMISELFEFSGIITLLSCGITMGHYTWYNLSPQSKNTTSLTIEALGFGAEAFVFVYLGLTCFSYGDYEWSYEFFIIEFIVVVVGRFIGVVGLLYLVSFIFRHKKELNFNEAVYLYIAGMIRGAIAFGLVLRMDESLPNRGVIVTTSLCLVIVTTVIFGSSMPIMTKYLLVPAPTAPTPQISDEESKNSEELLEIQSAKSEESSYENFKHPNEVSLVEDEDMKKFSQGKCATLFKKIDEDFIRPMFIYKYEKSKKDKDYELYANLREQLKKDDNS